MRSRLLVPANNGERHLALPRTRYAMRIPGSGTEHH
jgi:hypothetical protein